MNLNTERCLIRNLRMEDAEALHSILSDENVMRYIEPVFDMERTKNFIRSAGMSEPPLVYAIVWKQTDQVIGQVIFHPFERSADYEIGWLLNRDYWGIGIAAELTKELVCYARHAGIGSCVIECHPEQLVSRKIAIKHGFVPEESRILLCATGWCCSKSSLHLVKPTAEERRSPDHSFLSCCFSHSVL